MSASGLPMLITVSRMAFGSAARASPSALFFPVSFFVAAVDVGSWLAALGALRKDKGGKRMLRRMLTLEVISCVGLGLGSIVRGCE